MYNQLLERTRKVYEVSFKTDKIPGGTVSTRLHSGKELWDEISTKVSDNEFPVYSPSVDDDPCEEIDYFIEIMDRQWPKQKANIQQIKKLLYQIGYNRQQLEFPEDCEVGEDEVQRTGCDYDETKAFYRLQGKTDQLYFKAEQLIKGLK